VDDSEVREVSTPHSWVTASVIVLLGGVVPVLLARNFHALGIPRNDDWAYILAAFRFADVGRINGHGWASMNLIGQLILSAPVVWLFGHRIAPLQLEVVVLGIVGLWATFDLAAHISSRRRALFVAALVAVGPMWASLSVSYMTDIPAFCLAMACLAVGVRAVSRDRVLPGLLCVSLLFGFLAFSVREYAIVAPLAVVLVAIWSAGPQRRAVITGIVALAVLLVLSALLFAWRRSLPDFAPSNPQRPTIASIKAAVSYAAQSAVLVGLLVTPAILLAGPKKLLEYPWRRAPRAMLLTAAGMGLVLGLELFRRRHDAIYLGPGNYVLPTGTFGNSNVGIRPFLLPSPLLAAMAVVGATSMVILACIVVQWALDTLQCFQERRFERPPCPGVTIVSLSVGGYAVLCGLPAVFALPMYDRYLLPLVPLSSILVLHTRSDNFARTGAAQWAFGCSSLALVALVGVVYAANSASFDGAKWKVAEEVTSPNTKPRQVDGGFEWNSFHQGRPVFTRPDACIALTAEADKPSHDPSVLRIRKVWGPTGAQAWIVARQRRPCSDSERAPSA